MTKTTFVKLFSERTASKFQTTSFKKITIRCVMLIFTLRSIENSNLFLDVKQTAHTLTPCDLFCNSSFFRALCCSQRKGCDCCTTTIRASTDIHLGGGRRHKWKLKAHKEEGSEGGGVQEGNIEEEWLINQEKVRLLNQGWLCLGETIKPVIICLCCTDLAIIGPYLTTKTERAGSIYLHPIAPYRSSF